MIKGSYTALITPFDAEGNLDEQAFEKIITHQIQAGTHGIVPCGTTGESPTISHNEHNQIIKLAIEIAGGNCQVMAGTGSNSTREAISMTQEAQEAGANSALLVVPYYNKPTQEGLYLHYKKIHDNTDIPIILYNVPGRTITALSNDTIARLANDCERIVGVKDATAELERPQDLIPKINGEFFQLSGEDDSAVEFNRRGGTGCISVTANIVPDLCSKMQSLCLNGNFDEADKIQKSLVELNDAMFCETNPIPVKYAAHLMGLCSEYIRLPLTVPSDAAKAKIKTALQNLDLI